MWFELRLYKNLIHILILNISNNLTKTTFAQSNVTFHSAVNVEKKIHTNNMVRSFTHSPKVSNFKIKKIIVAHISITVALLVMFQTENYFIGTTRKSISRGNVQQLFSQLTAGKKLNKVKF